MGTFIVHNRERRHSSYTNPQGQVVYTFYLFNDLKQLIHHPTRVPDCHIKINTIQIPDLFSLTDFLSYSISVPLGSSDRSL